MKYEIIKGGETAGPQRCSELPLPICELRSSDKNPHMGPHGAFGTSKTVLRLPLGGLFASNLATSPSLIPR